MNDRTILTIFRQFVCDKCGEENVVSIPDDVDENYVWPDGWLLIRSSMVHLPIDDERMLCSSCANKVILAMGFTSLKEYQDVVKATDAALKSEAKNPRDVN